MTNLPKDPPQYSLYDEMMMKSATRSIFANVETRVSLTCSRCEVLPNVSESDQIPKGKLFETFSNLKSHNEFYHNFEYRTLNPDLVFEISEEERSKYEFNLCHLCNRLCITPESYMKHLRLDHDPKKAEMANEFLTKTVEYNIFKVERKSQRERMVETILKYRDDKSSVWKTEGDPEAYDIDQVLKDLNEVCILVDVHILPMIHVNENFY